MAKRNSKTARIVAALALSAGLFSATNANAFVSSSRTGYAFCESDAGATPFCYTPSLSISKGKTLHFRAVAQLRGDRGSPATFTIHNGSWTVLTKKIYSPYISGILVTGDNRKFTGRIDAGWNDTQWQQFQFSSGSYVAIDLADKRYAWW